MDMKLRHLQRDLKTALELALVALAPRSLIEGIACAVGLIEALLELPLDSEPLRPWALDALGRAERSLCDWHAWQEARRISV